MPAGAPAKYANENAHAAASTPLLAPLAPWGSSQDRLQTITNSVDQAMNDVSEAKARNNDAFTATYCKLGSIRSALAGALPPFAASTVPSARASNAQYFERLVDAVRKACCALQMR